MKNVTRFATLDSDGWELDSAVALNEEHPDTFHVPTRRERESLEIGQEVKLLFLLENEENGEPIIDCERMWVRVAARDGTNYIGTLLSSPVTSPKLRPGHVVTFTPDHVASITVTGDPAWERLRSKDVAPRLFDRIAKRVWWILTGRG